MILLISYVIFKSPIKDDLISYVTFKSPIKDDLANVIYDI